MSRCRYEQVRCDGHGSHSLSLCNDGCRGPVDLSPKEAKKDTREVKQSMPKPEKSPVGDCPTCERKGVPLASTKHHPGERVCAACVARIAWHANKGKKAGQKSATKARSAAKEASAEASKAAVKIDKPRPASAVTEAPVNGIIVRFSLHVPAGTTALEMMDLLRAVPSSAVVSG